jgi:hypothetical protein
MKTNNKNKKTQFLINIIARKTTINHVNLT